METGNHALPFRIVLVMQGGGAHGAYYGGVYQALHESGLEPDWIIGTSIGAITGAIIAGNEVEHRLRRLREFWDGLVPRALEAWTILPPAMRRQISKEMALMGGCRVFSLRISLSLSVGAPGSAWNMPRFIRPIHSSRHCSGSSISIGSIPVRPDFHSAWCA